MISIDQYWLETAAVTTTVSTTATTTTTSPMHIRAGMQIIQGKVLFVSGSVQAPHAYLFNSRRGTRSKVQVSDEFGLWLMSRQWCERAFHWQTNSSGTRMEMTECQFEARVPELP